MQLECCQLGGWCGRGLAEVESPVLDGRLADGKQAWVDSWLACALLACHDFTGRIQIYRVVMEIGETAVEWIPTSA